MVAHNDWDCDNPHIFRFRGNKFSPLRICTTVLSSRKRPSVITAKGWASGLRRLWSSVSGRSILPCYSILPLDRHQHRFAVHVCIYIYTHTHTHRHTHTHTDTQFMKAAMLLVSIKVTLLVRRVCKLYVAVCTKVRSFFGISQMDRSLCACEPQDVCSGKSSPVTGLDRPRGLQEVKVPRFRDNGTGWWSVVSLTHRPPLPPGNIPGTHFC